MNAWLGLGRLSEKFQGHIDGFRNIADPDHRQRNRGKRITNEDRSGLGGLGSFQVVLVYEKRELFGPGQGQFSDTANLGVIGTFQSAGDMSSQTPQSYFICAHQCVLPRLDSFIRAAHNRC
jgi:hypothetical protein